MKPVVLQDNGLSKLKLATHTHKVLLVYVYTSFVSDGFAGLLLYRNTTGLVAGSAKGVDISWSFIVHT